MGKRRKGAPWLICVTVLALLATGTYLVTHSTKRVKPPAAPVAGKNTFSVAPEQVSGTSKRSARPTIKFEPHHVYIPSLGISARTVNSTISGSGLTIPEDVSKVGLYAGGGSLTGKSGTVLLAGHVNFIGQGNGALYRLTKIKPGADIFVTGRTAEPTHWRAYALRSVTKHALPQDIFSATGPRRAVLVTCGGKVVSVPGYGNTYEDNELAYAVQVRDEEA